MNNLFKIIAWGLITVFAIDTINVASEQFEIKSETLDTTFITTICNIYNPQMRLLIVHETNPKFEALKISLYNGYTRLFQLDY